MVVSALKDIGNSYMESWNRIVKILGEMLGADVALINSVKGEKLEVLKTGGFSEGAFQENVIYDLNSVYCEGVVNSGEMLEINNASQEEKWNGYKGLEFGLISYLGFPIFNTKGDVIGTICVEDSEEKYFSETEKELLREFKQVIEDQIKQLELSKKLEENIERGRALHKRFLPAELPQVSQLSFGTYYHAANRLGGDFYDVIQLENKILFYVSDVSGHDLSSSMLNIFLKEAVNSYLIYQQNEQNHLSPDEIISSINERFKLESFPADYFISLVMGIIDLKSFELELSNAGFQFPPVITKKDGSISSVVCTEMPITILEKEHECEVCTYQFQPGDTLHINTDGLIEQSGQEGNFYSEDRMIKLLSNNAGEAPDDILQELYEDFFEFKGDKELEDDLTSLLIQRQGRN